MNKSVSMFFQIRFVLLMFVFLTLSFGRVRCDYCSLNCDQYQNIGCNNDGELKSTCPENAETYEFDEQEIILWLHLHNEYRNKIANGSIDGFESASRMARSKWSTELAQMAALNTRDCYFKHDDCRRTEKYKYSGQNIALIGRSDDFPESNYTINKIFSLWFNEYKYTDMSIINLFHSSKVKIGHFTQIVNDKNIEFGCGATKYRKDIFYYWYIACNYSSANIRQYPVYKRGKPCSKCTKGCDTNYPALCSLEESIDPNNVYRKPI